LYEELQTTDPELASALSTKAMLNVFKQVKPLTKIIIIGVAEGRTHVDIGRALNMTADGVKKRLATFRRKVKEELECL
jgi:DNA-directed RNA polymerase specialized sigma24 family protein